MPMNTHSPLVLPDTYEILITDIKDSDLLSIGRELGVKRLESITDASAVRFPVYGIMRGISTRMFVPLVVSKRNLSIHVIFLIDTGSPNTYIRTDTLEKLGCQDYIPTDVNVDIQGVTLTVYPSHSHFDNVDLLGQDFMSCRNVKMVADYRRKVVLLEESD